MCEISGVSRSGYYKYLKSDIRQISREESDLKDFQLIQEAYSYRGYDKGVMGIHMRLLHMGIRMNHKKIRRLMRKYGLYYPIRKANPYRRMAKAKKNSSVADNALKREFRQHGSRKIFLTDITYIPMKSGFSYLSVIMDAYTKQVMSYVMSNSLEVDLVLETVQMMIAAHGESIEATALIHSDQGSHYTSVSFRELLRDYGLRQSMSRRGNCWDNAPQESFFGHMKSELKGKQKYWYSYEDVKPDIDDWMDYYNKDRYQLGLDKLSPDEYYQYITTGEYPLLV